MTGAIEEEVPMLGGARTAVHRRGDVVLRAPGPWSAGVVELLGHVGAVGFRGAPRVIGTGFAADGRETLEFVEGRTAHPQSWPDEVLPVIGRTLRQLHDASSSYVPPDGTTWQPWFGRDLGDPRRRVLGHCDTGPWNLLVRRDGSVALIDWETAGPVDPLVELAQACWLNAQLHGDTVAARQGLGDVRSRARQARALLDGYGLAAQERAEVLDLMVQVAVADAAEQVRSVTDEQETGPIWAVAWRVDAAAWMQRHRAELRAVIVG